MALPINEVFHSLPQANNAGNPTSKLAAAYPAASTPAPAFEPSPAPALRPESSTPPQPVNFQPQNLFGNLFPGSPTPEAPQTQPPALAAQPGAWQSAGAPEPLFRDSGPLRAAAPRGMDFPQTTQQPQPAPASQHAPMPEAPAWAPVSAPPAQPAPQASFPQAVPSFSAPSAPMRAVSSPAPAPMGGAANQLMLRALLGASGPLSKQDVVRHLANLPGAEACFFANGPETLTEGGSSQEGSAFLQRAADVARGIQAIALASGVDTSEPFAFESSSRTITFMVQGSCVLALLHKDRSPVAGLREKVAVLCKELAAM